MLFWGIVSACFIAIFLCGYLIGTDKGERNAHARIVAQQLATEKQRKQHRRQEAQTVVSAALQEANRATKLRLVKGKSPDDV